MQVPGAGYFGLHDGGPVAEDGGFEEDVLCREGEISWCFFLGEWVG